MIFTHLVIVLQHINLSVFRFGHTMIPPGIYRRRLSSKTEGKCEFVPARNGGETHYHIGGDTLSYTEI